MTLFVFSLLLLSAVSIHAFSASSLSRHVTYSQHANEARAVLLAADGLDEAALMAKLAGLKKRSSAKRSTAPIPTPASIPQPVPEATPQPAENPAWLQDLQEEGLSAMDRLAVTIEERREACAALDASALAAVSAFLNEYFAEGLLDWVMTFTDVGITARKKNAWSRSSWTPISAALVGPMIAVKDGSATLHLRVMVQERGVAQETEVTAELSLPEGPYETVDDLRDALLQLHFSKANGNDNGNGDASPAAGGILLRLPGATDRWSLPDDLWLNTTPYRKKVRNFFYDDVVHAMQAAVADKQGPQLMKVTVTPPCVGSCRSLDPTASHPLLRPSI